MAKAKQQAADLSPIEVDALTEDEAGRELARLAKLIAHHDKRYHQQDAPEIADAEYDALVRRNREIEARFPALVRADSPSRRVGAAPATGFRKVKHLRPMLSLENAFDDDDVRGFFSGVRNFIKELRDDPELPVAVTAEPKIDGLSISLLYERGVFVRGATRGYARRSRMPSPSITISASTARRSPTTSTASSTKSTASTGRRGSAWSAGRRAGPLPINSPRSRRRRT